MRRLSAGFGMKLPYRAGLEPDRDYVTADSLSPCLPRFNRPDGHLP